MLSAKITEEEAEKFCEEQELKKENFCHTEEIGPNVGDLVITMPCRRLLGRPADYVSCRAYGDYRPAVCGSYLCRVAVQYKTGLLELDEAVELIREAYATGNVAYFNWIKTEDEEHLMRASLVPRLLKVAQEAYAAVEDPAISLEDVENIYVAEALTPVFVPATPQDHLRLNLLFDIFDRGALDLEDIIGMQAVELLDEGEEKFASMIAKQTISRFRALFKKEK
jgi:hypothetical protein